LSDLAGIEFLSLRNHNGPLPPPPKFLLSPINPLLLLIHLAIFRITKALSETTAHLPPPNQMFPRTPLCFTFVPPMGEEPAIRVLFRTTFFLSMSRLPKWVWSPTAERARTARGFWLFTFHVQLQSHLWPFFNPISISLLPLCLMSFCGSHTVCPKNCLRFPPHAGVPIFRFGLSPSVASSLGFLSPRDSRRRTLYSFCFFSGTHPYRTPPRGQETHLAVKDSSF